MTQKKENKKNESVKLWDKGINIDKEVETFTVGNDYILDKKLVKYDCIASIAHAKMLKKIGIINDSELKKLINGLNEIISLDEKKKFEITPVDEDCHTAIEKYLTKKYGEAGKKIHTLRSRNDQVLTAMRLYEKSELLQIQKMILEFQKTVRKIALKNGKIEIPGYTHMQKAMPTNINSWLSCYDVSMNDNLEILDETLEVIDKSPLGTAAGFGVPIFKIDREFTSNELGFEEVLHNPIYAQHSRGKFEANIINTLSQIMYDLNKLSTDLIMFSMVEFGYVELPKEFCTGSSIMPQKKNPDVLELVRAKYHIMLGDEFKIKSLIGNLMFGYNRDLQLTKEPLFNSIDTTKACLAVMTKIVERLKFNEKKCKHAMTSELYATQDAYKLVKDKKMAFRDAYKVVGKQFS